MNVGQARVTSRLPNLAVGGTGGVSSVVVDDGSEREASLSRPGGSAALVV